MPSVARRAWRFALIYVLLASLWIAFSDQLVNAFVRGVDGFQAWQIYKGLLLAAVTGVLLFIERSQAEARLLAEIQHRDHLLARAPLPIVTLNRDLHVTQFNPAACRLFGWTKTELEGGALRGAPAEAPALWQAALNRQGGLSGELIELTWQHKEGAELQLLMAMSADELAPGGRELICIFEDICERKEAEKLLRESEERYRILVEAAPEGIAIHQQGKLVFVNSAGAALLGAENPDDLIGKAISEIVHPDRLDATAARIERLIAGEKGLYPVQDQYLRLDGSSLPVEVMAVPTTWSGEPAIQVIVRDVSERQAREIQLRYHALLLENVSDAIIATDLEFRVMAWNRAAEEIYGWTAVEAVGQQIGELVSAAFEQQTREAVMTEFQSRDSWKGETIHYNKAGQPIWILASVKRIIDRDGSIVGVMSVNKDVTDRKRVDNELRKSVHRLSILHEIDQAIMASNPLDALLETVLQRLSDLIPCDRVTILLRSGRDLFDNFVVAGPVEADEPAPLQRISASELEHLELLLQQDFVLLDNLAQLSARPPLAQQMYDKGYRCLLNVPLRTKDKLHGVISLGSRLPSAFDAADVDTARSIAGQIALAVQNVRLIDELERRISELNIVHLVSQRLQQIIPPEMLAQELVQIMGELLGYHFGAVLLVNDKEQLVPFALVEVPGFLHSVSEDKALVESFDLRVGRGIVGWVAEHGESVRLGDVRQDSRYVAVRKDIRSEMCVPVLVGNHVVGVVNTETTQLDAYSERDQQLLETVAAQFGIAIQNSTLLAREQKSQTELRDLANYLQSAQETERTRIAREIHDVFGQILTALKMDTVWVNRRLPGELPELRRKTEEMADLIDTAVNTVRQLASELRPGLLDDLGLIAAIEWQVSEFARRTEIRCDIRLDVAEVALDRDRSTAVFRILQEALTNAARHADASQIWIRLIDDSGGLKMSVRDNGIGMSANQLNGPGSFGLVGMRERAHAFGGAVTFTGMPGAGTTVTLQMPWLLPAK